MTTSPELEAAREKLSRYQEGLPDQDGIMVRVADLRTILSYLPASDAGERVKVLEEALRPFAEKASQFSRQLDGDVIARMDFVHFRRARAALTTKES